MKKVCGAKLRGKDRTCQKSPMANGRCRLHGGATPSGPDSANFKHGRYAAAFKGRLSEKFRQASQDRDPLDLLTELHVHRTVLDQYIEDVSKKKKHKMTDLFNISMLAKDVVHTGAVITKLRNDQALTLAEIKFFQKGIVMILEKYVPDPNQRRHFIADLSALIPDRNDAQADEPAELPTGTG